MKVKIVKAPTIMKDGGKLKAYTGDKYPSKGRPAGWNKSKYSGNDAKLEEIAKKVGFQINDNTTNADLQKYLMSDEVAKKYPYVKQAIEQAHKTYGDPNSGTNWFDNNFGIRWDPIFDAIDGYKAPKFADKEEIMKRNQPGNTYEQNLDEFKKAKYNQKNLPISQIAPDLANFANAQNIYGYYTPDFTHWEVNPQKLNIQPQLQDVDASLNALYNTTTGNPALDAAQKGAAFVEGLKAKQNVFGRKQNYDADSRMEADKYNMSARTNEQNMDVEATNTVHNQYRAAAKDYASYERINALQDIVKKQALNKANESEKSLWLDNFYNNVEVDDNGNLNVKGSGIDFNYDPYDVNTEDVSMTAIDNSKPFTKPGDPGFVGPVQGPIVPGNPNFVGPLKKSGAPRNPNYVEPVLPELFMTKPIKGENGMMTDYNYDPSYMMPMRPIKKEKTLDKYFLRK